MNKQPCVSTSALRVWAFTLGQKCLEGWRCRGKRKGIGLSRLAGGNCVSHHWVPDFRTCPFAVPNWFSSFLSHCAFFYLLPRSYVKKNATKHTSDFRSQISQIWCVLVPSGTASSVYSLSSSTACYLQREPTAPTCPMKNATMATQMWKQKSVQSQCYP